MAGWLRDLRLAARMVWNEPRFSIFAALLLAVAIAAGTTLFSIADAVLFRPFPFADQDRLVVAGENLREPRSEISWRDVQGWRAGSRVFEALCAISSTEWTWDLRTSGDTVSVRYRSVSGNFFEVLGAGALAGRTFGTGDDYPGAARTVVLSHGFWQRQFGGDPDIVGRVLVFSDTAYTVVGIMPPAFAFPAATDVWTPLIPDLAAIARGISNGPIDVFDVGVLFVLGRLHPGVSIETAHRLQ
jgi:putative ABC transport system permease protein